MMKNKFEVAANVVVILLAVVIGSVFLMDRFASTGLGPNEVKAGDQLPGLHAYNWKAHDRTLVLALRNGCHFCEDSMPFYRKLAQLERSNQIAVHLVAVFPDDPAVVHQVVETQQLTLEVLPGFELGQVKGESARHSDSDACRRARASVQSLDGRASGSGGSRSYRGDQQTVGRRVQTTKFPASALQDL